MGISPSLSLHFFPPLLVSGLDYIFIIDVILEDRLTLQEYDINDGTSLDISQNTTEVRSLVLPVGDFDTPVIIIYIGQSK